MNLSLLQLLNRCQSLRSLKSIHARLLYEDLFNSSDLVLNRLLRLYSRNGAVDYARKVFDEIHQPNVFHWTAMIHGYVENRNFPEALFIFSRMIDVSIMPLNFTISSVFKALARLVKVKDGERLYGFVLKFGLGFDLIVQNAAIDFFMRCGRVTCARWIFDHMDEKDVVSWNSMISGYGSHDRVDIAEDLFNRMPTKTTITWTSMISGYIKSGDMVRAGALFEEMPSKDLASWKVMVSGYMDMGDVVTARHVFEAMPIHDIGTWNLMISGFCRARDIESAKDFFNRLPNRNVASWTIMMDGYLKAGDAKSARCLFDQMPEKNLVTWSTMIGGYARNGQPHNALQLLKCFREKDIIPDKTFVLEIISACSQLGFLDTVESVISDYIGASHFSDLQVVTSLIDMYAKCGSIRKACQVFEMASGKDLLCYSTMIVAFANHGLAQEAISLFEEMKEVKIKPDGVTFLGVLTACNHGGLVDEGRKYFKQMEDDYRICPSEKHYACIVDLLGRAGCLDEAHNIISNMPIPPNAVVWGALLAACRVHCNVELGEVAAAELFKIEPDNSGNYVLLYNIYASTGRWDSAAKVRMMIKEHQVKKNRGSSWIDLGCVIHEFVTGDKSHNDSDSIYLILVLLSKDMEFLSQPIDPVLKGV